jgi:hypothetical protein
VSCPVHDAILCTFDGCLWLQLPVSCPSANLKSITIAYHKRIGNLEAEKYDLEYEVAKKNLEVRIFKAAFLKVSGTAEPLKSVTYSPTTSPQNYVISRKIKARRLESLNL